MNNFIIDCDPMVHMQIHRETGLFAAAAFSHILCYNTNSVYFEQRAEALPLLFISSFVDRPQWFLLSTLLQQKEFFF